MSEKLTRYLRISEVCEVTGVSRTTIWRWTRSGDFPAKRKLGPNSIGWCERAVGEWLANRPVAEAQATDGTA
jgi:prophage regulatory protein